MSLIERIRKIKENKPEMTLNTEMELILELFDRVEKIEKRGKKNG